jgi:hypothetical protein
MRRVGKRLRKYLFFEIHARTLCVPDLKKVNIYPFHGLLLVIYNNSKFTKELEIFEN